MKSSVYITMIVAAWTLALGSLWIKSTPGESESQLVCVDTVTVESVVLVPLRVDTVLIRSPSASPIVSCRLEMRVVETGKKIMVTHVDYKFDGDGLKFYARSGIVIGYRTCTGDHIRTDPFRADVLDLGGP